MKTKRGRQRQTLTEKFSKLVNRAYGVKKVKTNNY